MSDIAKNKGEKMIYRMLNVEKDREILLNAHCAICFASDSPWAIDEGYTAYREKWMTTKQPEIFLSDMAKSIEDPRTLAVFVENESDERVGYLWVRFTDIPDYHYVYAEIDEIIVFEPFRRSGYASMMMAYAKDWAKIKGANILRSRLAAQNTASRKLHEKMGLKLYGLEYEMEL